MTLLDTLNAVKVEYKPLPTHYLATHADTYLREQYATLLAAIMLDNGSISRYQNELYVQLLGSLQLEAQPSSYFNASQQIDTTKVIELIKHLDKSGHINLLFDAILLLRIDTPLDPDQVKLINALIDVFEISENNVLLTVFWANKALGIDANLDKKHQDKLHQLLKFRQIVFYTSKGFKSFCYKDSLVRKGDVLFQGVIDVKSGGKQKVIKKDFEYFFNYYPFGNSPSRKDGYYDLLAEVSMETGWVLKADKELSENFEINYSLLPLPTALNNWTDFFAEVYPTKVD